MAQTFKDRVMVVSTTTGTGTYTLGSAVTGYQTFAIIGDGNTAYYAAEDVDVNGVPIGGWEVGIGTYATSGTTLARTTILASSNANAAVSWAAGTRRVFVVASASWLTDPRFSDGDGLIFEGAADPITVTGGDDGFGDTAIVIDNTDDAYVVLKFPQYTDQFWDGGGGMTGPDGALIYMDPGGDLLLRSDTALTGSIYFEGESPTFRTTKGLVFPNEDGTPGAGTCQLVRLGGAALTAGDDVFISMVDAQPGDGDSDDGRKLVLYARNATSGNVVSGMSNILAGWWWNGSASIQSGIELENKVQASDGNPQFWIEKIFNGSSTPFIKMFMTGASDGAVVTNNDTASSLAFGAWDANDSQYRYFATLLSGNTPSFTIVPPSGGTVSIQATTYKSSDGSTGATGTGTAANTLTIKNGLVTNIA